MNTQRWQRIQEIFHGALDLPVHARGEYLDRECAGDAELRREVEEMIAADASDAALLEDAPGSLLRALADAAYDEAAAPSVAGRRIGPYSLIRLLGRGGMGSVYLAERTDVGMRCALKVVRGELASPESVRRMLFERRVLARLQHPHIARLLDAGVGEDGTPWFAMELVEGRPIDKYCAENDISLTKRLELFEKVCDAVAYAHRNLIVHRDLKPGNILVGGDGEPKLLDFGIAKLLEDQNADLTRTGMRLLTPRYAAPEQIAGNPITTATDVYALGLTLYELVTGAPPFALDERPIERRAIAPPPPRPSAVVKDVERRRALSGDLDAIVLRALASEPERRYGSAAELLDDLKRHREARPVIARPDTWTYRTRQFMRRNRAGVTIAASAVITLISFAGTMTVQQAETARQRDRAQTEAAKATQVSDFLVELFDVADPFSASAIRADSITLQDFLIQRGEKILALDSQPEVQLQALNVVGHMYFNLGLYDQASRMFEQALASGRKLHPDGSDQLVTALTNMGDLKRARSDFPGSEPYFREAVTMARRLHAGPHKSLAFALNGLGDALRQSGKYKEAEPILREALAVRKQVHGERSRDAADGYNNLGLVLWVKGDLAEAEPLLDQALEIQREVLPRIHPMTSATLNNIGLVRKSRGDMAGAEVSLREALEIKRELFGRNHWRVANGVINLASVLFELNRLEEAERLDREALAILREEFGNRHELIGVVFSHLGEIEDKRGNTEAAEQHFRESVRAARAVLPPAHPRITAAEFGLGRFLVNHNRASEALPLLENAHARYLKADGEDHLRTARAQAWLGGALMQLGQQKRAAPLLASALNFHKTKGDLANEDARDALRFHAMLNE